MVESALEFARIARKHDFHNFMFSMKSSNPKVMIECYRLLVARLDAAGPGLELPDPPRRHRGRRRRGRPHQERHRHRLAALRRPGRHHPRLAHRGFAARDPGLPRSARADAGADAIRARAACPSCAPFPFDPFTFERRATPEIELGRPASNAAASRPCGWSSPAPPATRSRRKIRPQDDVRPEAVYEDLNVLEVDPRDGLRGRTATRSWSP